MNDCWSIAPIPSFFPLDNVLGFECFERRGEKKKTIMRSVFVL